MSQVVDMLAKNHTLNEKELVAPGFSQDTTTRSSTTKKIPSTSTSTQMSSVPLSVTQLIPR